MEIFTIGHSTHTADEFIKLLTDAKIDFLVDVRSFPGSRKFPHFHKDQMKVWLPEAGIDYAHNVKLGGRRNLSKTVNKNVNNSWTNQSFHNYADYTLEAEFQEGLDELKKKASTATVAYFCAERHPARCHRLLISNWLSLNGWNVQHILDGPKGTTLIETHVPGKWGASPILRADNTVVYPE